MAKREAQARAEAPAGGGSAAHREGAPSLKLVVSQETDDVEAVPVDQERPTPAQVAEFFRTHEPQPEGGEPDHALPPAPSHLETPSATATRARNPARERLYADIGGAVIGMSAAAALINFVLLP